MDGWMDKQMKCLTMAHEGYTEACLFNYFPLLELSMPPWTATEYAFWLISVSFSLQNIHDLQWGLTLSLIAMKFWPQQSWSKISHQCCTEEWRWHQVSGPFNDIQQIRQKPRWFVCSQRIECLLLRQMQLKHWQQGRIFVSQRYKNTFGCTIFACYCQFFKVDETRFVGQTVQIQEKGHGPYFC